MTDSTANDGKSGGAFAYRSQIAYKICMIDIRSREAMLWSSLALKSFIAFVTKKKKNKKENKQNMK